ncbi:MAG: hypothetical protein R6X20_10540 [Phycisphaerae bacterium]
MRRPLIPILLLAIGCTAAAGCGAVLVPEVTQRPAPALRTVEVVDAVTGEPVTLADVRVARVPWSDYLQPHPWATWGEAQSPESALRRLAPGTDPADVPQSRPGRHLGDGWFAVPPYEEWAWHQVVFPFGGPQGAVVHHTRQAHLVVSAPGYRTVWVSEPWVEAEEARPARPDVRYEFAPAEPSEPGPRVRLTEAGLQVALPPRSLPTRGPQWRWHGPGQPSEAPPASEKEQAQKDEQEGTDG